MGKTLHIIPSGNIWPRIVGKWIGEGLEYDEVFVWHAEDADSRLLLYLFAYAYKHRFYAVNVTPKDRRFKGKVNDDVDGQFEDVKVYTDRNVDIHSITRDSFEVGTANKILPSFGCTTNFLCKHETRNYKNA